MHTLMMNWPTILWRAFLHYPSNLVTYGAIILILAVIARIRTEKTARAVQIQSSKGALPRSEIRMIAYLFCGIAFMVAGFLLNRS